MSTSLRDLLIISPPPARSDYRVQQFAVWNTSNMAALNGGCCCCWVVHTGITWAKFEVWSGGGAGGGACCCMGPLFGPGNGQYAKRQINVTPGTSFQLCAAGSGCCHTQCCGTCGFPSFVRCNTGAAIVTCANGGYFGCVACFQSYQGCVGHCYPSCGLSFDWIGEVGLGSFNSVRKESQYCWARMWSRVAGSPVFNNNSRHSPDYCCTQLTRQGCDIIHPSWPGGAGANARACSGGCCWGSHGTGGLVLVSFG